MNVRFRKEKWYSESEGKTYLAPLPTGYAGQFGPRLKAWVIVLTYALNVTESKIADFLETVGVSISSGQISAIIHQESEKLAIEKEAVYVAGLQSTSWQQIDDTGVKVNGQNCYTQVVCNPYYTAYFTTERKDRLTVLEVLWGGQELQFCLVGQHLAAFGIELPFTMAAVVIAQTFVAAPLYIRAAKTGFAEIDPRLEQVSATLGETPWGTFRRVTLPLARQALLGGAIMTWSRSLGEFGATILFAGNLSGRTQTMPLAIYSALQSNLNVALTLATILVITSFGVLALLRLVARS